MRVGISCFAIVAFNLDPATMVGGSPPLLDSGGIMKRRRFVGHRADGSRIYSRMNFRDWLVTLIAGSRGYVINMKLVRGIEFAPGNNDVVMYGNTITL